MRCGVSWTPLRVPVVGHLLERRLELAAAAARKLALHGTKRAESMVPSVGASRLAHGAGAAMVLRLPLADRCVHEDVDGLVDRLDDERNRSKPEPHRTPPGEGSRRARASALRSKSRCENHSVDGEARQHDGRQGLPGQRVDRRPLPRPRRLRQARLVRGVPAGARARGQPAWVGPGAGRRRPAQS